MHYTFAELPAGAGYKLITGVVVPRPIAWVSTLNEDGTVNLAPYSFFNVLGSDPVVVAFSPGNRSDGQPKDTARNVTRQNEFVVNMVSAELAGAMNISATDFPPGLDEAGVAGLALAPGRLVAVPHVQASPAALECRVLQVLTVGRNRIVLGEVLGLHIRDGMMSHPERHYVDSARLDLVGRMGGLGGYTHTRESFELGRVSYTQWQATQDKSVQGQATHDQTAQGQATQENREP
jgi:flavin reductase (DIM6/NTAB) family NADH-FMN oxidoreductase RutF